jgi:hypothetical protein
MIEAATKAEAAAKPMTDFFAFAPSPVRAFTSLFIYFPLLLLHLGVTLTTRGHHSTRKTARLYVTYLVSEIDYNHSAENCKAGLPCGDLTLQKITSPPKRPRICPPISGFTWTFTSSGRNRR